MRGTTHLRGQARTSTHVKGFEGCLFFFLLFFFFPPQQDQQKVYDELHAHKSHHHAGLGFHDDAAGSAAPQEAAAPAPSSSGPAPGDAGEEDPVARARAIAAKLGLLAAAPAAAPAGADLLGKRKFNEVRGRVTLPLLAAGAATHP